MTAPTQPLSLSAARRAWLASQHLLPTTPKPPLAELVGSIGWIPLPTGATAYLSLLARGAIARRAELDDAVFARRELALVPGPRGLVWLVPSAEAPLARAFAMADHASRETRVASSSPLTSHDLSSTREALRAALQSPRTPEELRATLPPAALRSLGEAGRRAGCPTLASMVLRSLWIVGEVERSPVEPRLDRERFRYAIEPQPRRVPSAAEAVDQIAARWLSAHAPITPRAFAAAFGIAAGRAASALKPLKTLPFSVDTLGSDFLAPATFTLPDAPSPHVCFLPVRDPLLDAHANLLGLVSSSEARNAAVRPYGSGPSVLIDGEIVGLWVWEPAVRQVTWRSFQPLALSLAEHVDRAALALTRFVLDELGALGVPYTTPTGRRPPTLPDAASVDL